MAKANLVMRLLTSIVPINWDAAGSKLRRVFSVPDHRIRSALCLRAIETAFRMLMGRGIAVPVMFCRFAHWSAPTKGGTISL
jgi:hypothetical protein